MDVCFENLCKAADAHLADDMRRQRDSAFAERDDMQRSRDRALRERDDMMLARNYARNMADAANRDLEEIKRKVNSDQECYRAVLRANQGVIESKTAALTSVSNRSQELETRLEKTTRLLTEEITRRAASNARIQEIEATARVADLGRRSSSKRHRPVEVARVTRQRGDADAALPSATQSMLARNSGDDQVWGLERRQTSTGEWEVLMKSRPSLGITNAEVDKWFKVGYWMASQTPIGGGRWDVVWGDSWINRKHVTITDEAFDALAH